MPCWNCNTLHLGCAFSPAIAVLVLRGDVPVPRPLAGCYFPSSLNVQCILTFFSLRIVLFLVRFFACKFLCGLFLAWHGQRDAVLAASHTAPLPPFSLVLQYSLQEMLRKSRVMEFMKFKLCFNENVFSISASLGA